MIFGNHKLSVAALVSLNFVMSLLGMAFPFVLGIMMDAMVKRQNIWLVVAIASLDPAIGVSRSVIRLLRQKVNLNKVWFPIQEYLRMKTINQYFLFSIGQLKEMSSGMSREIISTGEHSLQTLATLLVTDIAPVISRVIITIVILLSLHLPVGLIIMTGLLVYGLTVWHMRKKYVPRIKLRQKKDLVSSKQRGDLLAGAPLVKAFSKEDAMRERYRKIYQQSVEVSKATNTYIAVRNELMYMILVASKYIAMVTCIYLYYENKLTAGELVTARMWWEQVFEKIEALGEKYQNALIESTSAERFLDLINTSPAIHEIPHPVRLEKVAGFIEFKHVSFSYPAEEGEMDSTPVLRDISFHVHVGEKVAIVGASGSGKSTILSLLVRAYDPTAGVVQIDGHDLCAVDIHDLRSHIALVDQGCLTMEMTIEDNINMGAPAPLSQEKLLKLCASVKLDLSKFSKGLLTQVGEMGNRLSGGEKQRIAIARALASDAKILVLDEPTSALDAITEAYVQATINEVCLGRTTIIITHRLSTIQGVDRIIVLNDRGEIAATGTHRELLEKSGLYMEYVEKQQILI